MFHLISLTAMVRLLEISYKVDMPYMDIFFSAPTSYRIQHTQLVQDDYQIQNMHVAICLIIFGT